MKIEKVFFGISQSVSSPASYVSSVTVDGGLNLAVAYCEPIWAADEAAKFTDDLVAICERVGLADHQIHHAVPIAITAATITTARHVELARPERADGLERQVLHHRVLRGLLRRWHGLQQRQRPLRVRCGHLLQGQAGRRGGVLHVWCSHMV